MNRLLKLCLYLATPCALGAVLAAVLLLAFSHLPAAQARPLQLTFSVTHTNDSGAGSLRQALQDANAQPGADTILINTSGVITLASPLPLITEAVTIQGPGAGLLAVDGNDSFRVFDINTAATSIADLTVQGGNAAAETGGGIRSTGPLTLTQVNVISNTAQGAGGGIYAGGGLHLTGGMIRNNHSSNGIGGALRSCCVNRVSGTQFISNTSAGDGGGAFLLGEVSIDSARFEGNQCLGSLCDGGGLFSFSQTIITNTQFLNNTAQDQGGGASMPGNLVITDGLFQGNQAVTGVGGGLYAQEQAVLQSTDFVDNTSRGNGGGMYMFGTLEITAGRFEGNQSTLGAGGGLAANGAVVNGTQFLANSALEGGGFYQELADANLSNSLFAGNQAASGVGSALLLASPGRVTLLHNTLAGNGSDSGSAIEVFTGTVQITNSIITSHTLAISSTGSVHSDFNLFSGNTTDTQGSVTSGPNNLSGDPDFLNPAGVNFHLGPGSAALNRGTDAGLAYDFDGDPRPLDGSFEIGFDEASYITGLAIRYTPAIIEVGTAVTFSASVATGSGVSYTWDFGDHSLPAAGSPIEHIFTTPGFYSAAVTAANPWGSAVETVLLEVLPTRWEIYLALLTR